MYSDTSKVTFIPKAPVTTIQQPTSISGNLSSEVVSHGIGFLGWMGLLLLLATIIGAGGLFLYVGYFQSERTTIIEGLKKKQSTVDTKFISDAQRLSARIGFAKTLLEKQIYVTPLFESLHEKTLPSIQFDSFELKEKTVLDQTASSGGAYIAVLKGKAKSYEVIAQQSDVYATVTALKTHFFSDFKVEQERGLISFTLTIDLPARLGHDRFAPAETAGFVDGTQAQESTPINTSPVPTQ